VGLGLDAAADGLEEAEEDGAVDAVGQGARADACKVQTSKGRRKRKRISESRHCSDSSAGERMNNA
jgi:hypothetical protein